MEFRAGKTPVENSNSIAHKRCTKIKRLNRLVHGVKVTQLQSNCIRPQMYRNQQS